MDERAQLVRAAPGVTMVDRSEEGAPVLELIGHSVLLGKPLVDSLQEPMPVMCPALCDFLEDPASVDDSAVMSTGNCEWT